MRIHALLNGAAKCIFAMKYICKKAFQCKSIHVCIKIQAFSKYASHLSTGFLYSCPQCSLFNSNSDFFFGTHFLKWIGFIYQHGRGVVEPASQAFNGTWASPTLILWWPLTQFRVSSAEVCLCPLPHFYLGQRNHQGCSCSSDSRVLLRLVAPRQGWGLQP